MWTERKTTMINKSDTNNNSSVTRCYPIRVISSSFSVGGAAIAAKRWADSLNIPADWRISNKHTKWRLHRILNRIIERIIWTPHECSEFGAASVSIFSSTRLSETFNFVNFIHWVQGDFLNLKEMRKVTKHSYIYAHDEWLLTPIGHYLSEEYRRKTLIASALLRIERSKEQIIEGCNAVIVPSKWLQRKFKDKFPKLNVIVIPNPVPEVYFINPRSKSLREELHISNNVKILLFVSSGGANNKRKGNHLLTQIVNGIAAKIPDLYLITVGIDESILSDLKTPNFSYANVANAELMHNIYFTADLLLVLSSNDNFPQVCTEAQSSGLYLVGFDVGGVAETIVLPSISGKVTPRNNISDYVDECVRRLQSPEVQNRQAISNAAWQLWNENTVADKFLALLPSYPNG